jgi:hypothetical protein
MDIQPMELGIQLGGDPDEDAGQIADATAQLRRDLLNLDVDSVQAPSAGEAPAGTRSAELVALGALAVSITRTQLLPAVVTAIQSWLTRSRQRSVKLVIGGDSLELTQVGSAEQRRLTDEWLRRHEA